MENVSPTSLHNTSAEAHLLADAQTLNYEITLDGFPSANASERRGSMYANGAQQLAIRVKLWRAGGVVSPEEWDSLTLLYSDKKTKVDVLPIKDGEPPLLEVSGKWACTLIRSAVYEQAHDASPLVNAEEYSNNWTYRVLHLHSTMAETTGETDFYVCITGSDGTKHIMSEQPISISIRPKPAPSKSIITSKNIEGFDYTTDPVEPEHYESYKYDYNPVTVEYFILKTINKFITCDVKGREETGTQGRCSIIRFERDHAHERMCTVTGIVKNNNQLFISFDPRLYDGDFYRPFGLRLTRLLVHGYLDENTVVISVHRFNDISMSSIPPNLQKEIFDTWGNSLTLTFRDCKGNTFEEDISFPEKKQNHHRNALVRDNS